MLEDVLTLIVFAIFAGVDIVTPGNVSRLCVEAFMVGIFGCRICTSNKTEDDNYA